MHGSKATNVSLALYFCLEIYLKCFSLPLIYSSSFFVFLLLKLYILYFSEVSIMLLTSSGNLISGYFHSHSPVMD
jgi:hypothetical protein